MAENPTDKKDFISENDPLIQVLSGMILINHEDSKTNTFYTSDFFVIPAGTKGAWKSDGHGLVKYLVVEKSR